MPQPHRLASTVARPLGAAFVLAALAVSGCAAQAPAVAQRQAAPPARTTRTVSAAPTAPIDRLARIARTRWTIERYGPVTHKLMRVVAADPGLRRVLRTGDTTALQAYVRDRFARDWYHLHVSRMRISRGSRILVDAGVPFVVAASKTTLTDDRGRPRGTLEVSVQDVIGFVRFMHRNYPVDVVARGVGSSHVKTSLPVALSVRLPDRGTAVVAGRRYAVRSFTQKALGGEPVKVWILGRP